MRCVVRDSLEQRSSRHLCKMEPGEDPEGVTDTLLSRSELVLEGG